MDYPKFESLIEDKALFFSRIDKFSDIYEGKWARTNLESKVFVSDTRRGSEEYNEDRRILHASVKDILRLIYVTCFTIQEYESERMWTEYTKSPMSVAIESDFSRLKQSFTKYTGDNRVFTEIYASKIRYLENENENMDEWSALFPIIYKRKEYEYEKELRLFTTYSGIDLAIRQIRIEDLKKSGKKSIAEYLELGILPDYPALIISIDPKILISNVVIHPEADVAFLRSVERLLKHNSISITPLMSSIKKIR
jgi:hypothetical protein